MAERSPNLVERKKYTLCLDDDPMISKVIGKITGLSVVSYADPKKLLGRGVVYDPLAIFGDVHLGENTCGLDFVPRIRDQWPNVPIIVMTNDQSANLIGRALALGANDFLRKPLNPEELLGRMTARVSEMNERTNSQSIFVYDLSFNKFRRELSKQGEKVYLSQLEAHLFTLLAESAGVPIPKDVLRSNLWGDVSVSPNSLDKKISNLRQSLKHIESGAVVRSEYGGGVALSYESR